MCTFLTFLIVLIMQFVDFKKGEIDRKLDAICLSYNTLEKFVCLTKELFRGHCFEVLRTI